MFFVEIRTKRLMNSVKAYQSRLCEQATLMLTIVSHLLFYATTTPYPLIRGWVYVVHLSITHPDPIDVAVVERAVA